MKHKHIGYVVAVVSAITVSSFFSNALAGNVNRLDEETNPAALGKEVEHGSNIKHGENPSDASQTTTKTNPSAFGSKVKHSKDDKHGENPSDASQTTTKTNPSAFGSSSQ